MIRAIVTDIEGTTTDIRFVHQVLFPYARQRLAEFLRHEHEQPDVAAALDALRAENRWHLFGDGARGAVLHSSERALLEVFIPPDPKWRRAVVRRGDEVIRQALTLAFSPALAVPPPQR